MKNKKTIIAALLLFLIVQTRYYWEEYIGVGILLVMFILFVIFIVLLGIFISNLYQAAREKFAVKNRNIMLIILAVIISITAIAPWGLFHFEELEGKDKIIAEYEGTPIYSATLKLKENGCFIHSEYSLGVTRTKGNYRISNDTVYFSGRNLPATYYQYGIIKKEKRKYLGTIALYKNKKDKKPLYFDITKL